MLGVESVDKNIYFESYWEEESRECYLLVPIQSDSRRDKSKSGREPILGLHLGICIKTPLEVRHRRGLGVGCLGSVQCSYFGETNPRWTHDGPSFRGVLPSVPLTPAESAQREEVLVHRDSTDNKSWTFVNDICKPDQNVDKVVFAFKTRVNETLPTFVFRSDQKD